jgi:lipopolysaccharide export system permease protein
LPSDEEREDDVFGTILHRMILWELCKVFVLSLVGITGILLMAGIIAEASQQGLGPAQILAAIPLLIPSTLPYTIPATTLFATCVVYGRLSGDNEILAIKSAGINVLHVVIPGVLLGLVMSGVTMGLYYRIIPYTHRMLREMVFNDAEELIYSMLNKHQMISHPQVPYSIYVKNVQGRKLINPVFKRKSADGQIDIVANAREAELRVDVAHKLILIRMKVGVASGRDGSHGYFADRLFDVPLPPITKENRRPRDLTWEEILAKRQELEAQRDNTAAEIEACSARLLLEQVPHDLPEHIKNLKERQHSIEQNILHLNVELLMRPALSLGCLCFILVGCPIGIWFSRSDYLSSFITCFLPIILVYYPLMLCGTNMAKDGRFEPVVLVYAADVVCLLAALVLFRTLLRN